MGESVPASPDSQTWTACLPQRRQEQADARQLTQSPAAKQRETLILLFSGRKGKSAVITEMLRKVATETRPSLCSSDPSVFKDATATDRK